MQLRFSLYYKYFKLQSILLQQQLDSPSQDPFRVKTDASGNGKKVGGQP
jgi:hypothetical protein